METKTVYAYDGAGKYIGVRILDDTDRSPISGAWQIPAYMTEVKPPAAKEGYDIYYRSGKWEQVERPKPEPTPAPPEATEPKEPYIDPERVAIAEAVAELSEQVAALVDAQKGGDKK